MLHLAEDQESDSAKVWSILKYSNGIPIKNGSILSLKVADPRVTFPPKAMIEMQEDKFQEWSKSANNLSINWPNTVAKSDLWDEKVRLEFFNKKLKPNEYELNQQREKVISLKK